MATDLQGNEPAESRRQRQTGPYGSYKAAFAIQKQWPRRGAVIGPEAVDSPSLAAFDVDEASAYPRTRA